jgi:hypothetical protein
MLHDDGDAVRVGIKGNVKLIVRKLPDRLIRPTFVSAKTGQGSVEGNFS